MQVIRTREQVRDNRIIISIPEEFEQKEVDVIIMPVQKKLRYFKSINCISIKTKGVKFDRNESHLR